MRQIERLNDIEMRNIDCNRRDKREKFENNFIFLALNRNELCNCLSALRGDSLDVLMGNRFKVDQEFTSIVRKLRM